MRAIVATVVLIMLAALNGPHVIAADKYILRSEQPVHSAADYGAGPVPGVDSTPLPPEVKCSPTKDANGRPTSTVVCEQAANALMGLHWGIGLLYDSSHGGVGEVKIVSMGGNNVVRVNRESKSAARAAFELHYFLGKGPNPSWAWGPFVSLNSAPVGDLTDKSLFSSIGAGLMVGGKVDTGGQHSINLGIGWLIDTNVKRLAPGFHDGSVTTFTPGQEDQLLRTTTSSGFMALLSYNFAFSGL